HRLSEACDFLAYCIFGNLVVRDLEQGVRNEMGVADGDAIGYADAVHGEAHGVAPIEKAKLIYSGSPKRSLISATSASMACCSSLPSASSTTMLPLPAASIMTPMML